MKREEIYNAPKGAGIYCLRNSINGKCYIGQAIKLQKRLKSHWNNSKNPRYEHLKIYQAIQKHGIENFELIILEAFKDAFSDLTKKKLDKLEKYYIQKYDSYNNGYNYTLGGDGGVLGYKHTPESLEKIRQASIKQAKERSTHEENWAKAKNIYDGTEVIGISQKDLAEKLDIPYYVVRKCTSKTQKVASKQWVIARYLEDYPEVPDVNSEEFDYFINTQFKELSNKEEILEYIRNNPRCSYGEISQNYKLCKKTFYNYKKELGISFEQRIDVKVTKEEFLAFGTQHSKKEYMEHFNISEKTYKSYVEKYLNN